MGRHRFPFQVPCHRIHLPVDDGLLVSASILPVGVTLFGPLVE